MGEEKPSAEIYPPAGACSGRVYRAIRLVLPPDSFGGVAQAAAITCRRLLWFVHCPLPGAAHLYRSIPPSHRCLDNSYVGHELRDLSAQEKWSGYTIVRLGFPLIATDRASVEPGEAFPNVFPANRRGHHENSFVFMDSRKMIEDLFPRDPRPCEYLPGRKGVLFKQREYRLPDVRVYFTRNKCGFCFHFLYLFGKIYYISKVVESPNSSRRE